MPLIDNATLTIDAGNYFIADVGTPFPTDPLDPGAEWDNIGHTDIEEVIGSDAEGGEVTVLRSLQKKNLRSRTTPRTEWFTVNLQQFDRQGLKLYYGGNMVEGAFDDERLLGVPESANPTTKAFLAVYVDGDDFFCIYAPKADIIRNDSPNLSGDTEELSSLPLRITPLSHGSATTPYAVTPMGSTPVVP